MADDPATGKPTNDARPRVLVAHEDVGTCRLIRETLSQFGECDVDTSPTAQYAYDLALQREYKLFYFGLNMPVIDGELLYELLAKAYPYCHAGAKSAPAVVYIVESTDTGRVEALQREARVKGVLVKPMAIESIIARAKGIIPMRGEGVSFD